MLFGEKSASFVMRLLFDRLTSLSNNEDIQIFDQMKLLFNSKYVFFLMNNYEKGKLTPEESSERDSINGLYLGKINDLLAKCKNPSHPSMPVIASEIQKLFRDVQSVCENIDGSSDIITKNLVPEIFTPLEYRDIGKIDPIDFIISTLVLMDYVSSSQNQVNRPNPQYPQEVVDKIRRYTVMLLTIPDEVFNSLIELEILSSTGNGEKGALSNIINMFSSKQSEVYARYDALCDAFLKSARNVPGGIPSIADYMCNYANVATSYLSSGSKVVPPLLMSPN